MAKHGVRSRGARVSAPVAARFLASSLLAAAIAGAAAAQSPGPGCDPGETTFRFGLASLDPEDPKVEAAQALAADVTAGLEGRACLVLVADAERFDDAGLIAALLAGEIELAAPELDEIQALAPAFAVFDLPFLFETPEAVEWFQSSGPGMRVRRGLEPAGLKALGYWNAAMEQLATRTPVSRPEDARGLRFAVDGPDEREGQFDAIGARAAPLDDEAIGEALAAGRIDGFEGSWALIAEIGLEGVASVTETNHGIRIELVTAPMRFWEGLPNELRAALAQAVTKATTLRNERTRAVERAARAVLIERGATVRALTPDERAAWVAAMRPIWRELEGRVEASLIEAAANSGR